MPPELNSPSKSHRTTICAIIYGISYLIVTFIPGWAPFITGLIVMAIWLLLFGILSGIRRIGEKTDQKGEYRKDLLVGLAGICIVGYTTSISVLPDPFNDWFFYTTIFSSLLPIALFFKVYIKSARKQCRVRYEPNDKLPWIVLFINIISFFITGEIALSFWWQEIRARLFYTQIVFMTISTISMVEFAHFWFGRFDLVGEHDPVIFDGLVEEAETQERKQHKLHKYLIDPIKRLFYIKLSKPWPKLQISDIIQRIHILVFAATVTLGLLYYTIFGFFNFWNTALAIVAVGLYSVSWTLFCLGFNFYEKNGKKRILMNEKTQLVIGLVGGCVASWIPRITVFTYVADWVNVYINFTSLLLIILFYLFFTGEAKKSLKVVYKTTKLAWIIFTINIVILTVMIQYQLEDRWDVDNTWSHLVFFTISTLTSIELCQIWFEGVVSVEKITVENPAFEKTAFLGPLVHKPPKIEIPISTQELSDYLDGIKK